LSVIDATMVIATGLILRNRKKPNILKSITRKIPQISRIYFSILAGE